MKLFSSLSLPSSFQLSRSAFTLVEILVVMAIIGILATLGTSSFLSARLRARDAERKSDIGQIQRSLELYYSDYTEYPDESVITPLLSSGNEFRDANGSLYMSSMPTEPRTPAFNYIYDVDATDNQKYRLYARLENTEDLATDIDGNGSTGDEYSTDCGDDNCNFGVSSPSTNMTEVW
jgi:prepilin-type N-terminal cleavage/methylation domain-containing protein